MDDTLYTQTYKRITITLTANEADALRVLASQERRDARQQAAVSVRRELEQRGLLPSPDNTAANPAPTLQYEASHAAD